MIACIRGAGGVPRGGRCRRRICPPARHGALSPGAALLLLLGGVLLLAGPPPRSAVAAPPTHPQHDAATHDAATHDAATHDAARHDAATRDAHRSLADHRLQLPTAEEFMRVVMLRDYNTRVVMVGTVLLGAAAGLVGVFMLLRRRSLLGDVISHASLPGIGIAFLVMEIGQAGSGKWLPGLLLGAVVAGLLGILSTKLILRYTRVKEDAALAIVLSVFFGLGIALFTVIQNIPRGNAAGLNQFIFGKAASMVADDVWLIAVASLIIAVLVVLLFKEFSLLSFDELFAAAEGWPVFLLDLVLMGLVTGVTVIGLQSVGLLLVVAMLIIPAAAARFWTHNLRRMTLVSAAIGAASAYFGVLASALFPRLAAGAVIVLTGALLFVLSMLLGRRRGVLVRLAISSRLRRRVGRQHVLRACFEFVEARSASPDEAVRQLTQHVVSVDDLLPMRSWTRRRVARLLAAAQRDDLLIQVRPDGYRLTKPGAAAAHRVVRNHRLWELYLVEYADIAPSHVDRDADDIEHMLGPDVVSGLEKLLSQRYPHITVPPSPHVIEA